MYATTQLGPLLAERGITLSREQVYRLVTGMPERLSLATLAALCDILGCQPGDLIEVVKAPAASKRAPAAPAQRPRPVRARVDPGRRRAVTVRCPAGHELTSHGLRRPCAACRRDTLIQHVITADGSLPASEAAAAVDAVATSPAVLRELAAALAADPDMLRHGRAAGGRAAGRRADRPRVDDPDPARVRALRPGRDAALPHTRRRHVQAVHRPPDHRRLRALRRGQAGRRPRRRRAAHLRAVPPPRPRAPPVRGLRPDRLDRGAGPRRRAGHLRQLLPDAQRRLQRVRQVPGMQLRRQRPSGLPVVLAAGDRPLRPLRPGPPAAGPLARRPGLRPVLHRRAAAPGTVRILRAAAAAGRPARPGRRHLRQLRRAARHLRMHGLRHRGQALSRAAGATGAACGGAPRRCSPDPARTSRPRWLPVLEAICAARTPKSGAQLAAQQRRRRDPRPGRRRDPARHSPGAR